MYDNIGKKIKGLAIATFIIEAVASVIAGFIFALEGEDFGAFLLLLGPFCSLAFLLVALWFWGTCRQGHGY